MSKRTKVIWAVVLIALVAAVCLPLLRKMFLPPNVSERLCIADTSLACSREDWVQTAPDTWEQYLSDGTFNRYKFVRREIGPFSRGTVVAPEEKEAKRANELTFFIPDEGQEQAIRFMRDGEWFDYLDTVRVPSQVEKIFQDGEQLLVRNKSSEAIAQFSKCLEMDPRFTVAYIMRGYAYLQAGDTKNAIVDCNKSIELVPYCPGAYELRAKVYDKQGDIVQSAKDRKKSQELSHR